MLERQREALRERLTRPGRPASDDTHLEAALAWLYRAQDAGDDRGVSHSYRIGRGWLPSYHETTGYIIPTLLNLSEKRADPEARRRALEMADWELTVQLPSGAIPNLVAREPVVFNTAQVVFGWLAAFRVTGDERFLTAARRAGRWLVEVMDPDGAWRRYTGTAAGVIFYARAAWALVELASITGDEQSVAAARRFLAWSLDREEDEGWFGENCLTDNDRPLLHTIAYAAQGQLESGLALGDSRLIEAATRTARALAAQVRRDGWLAGRYARRWRPEVRWACLTGMAQISIVWARLHGLTPEPVFAEAAERVNRYLKATQDLTSRNPGLRGGIRGSFPIHGAYLRYSVPNWATKFFLDALLHAPSTGARATYPG
jgi:uncharacterized protein YyaL (SSP411 family)